MGKAYKSEEILYWFLVGKTYESEEDIKTLSYSCIFITLNIGMLLSHPLSRSAVYHTTKFIGCSAGGVPQLLCK